MKRLVRVAVVPLVANTACVPSYSSSKQLANLRAPRARDVSPTFGPEPFSVADIEALIRQKVEGAYDRYCIAVWLKRITVAPVADEPDRYWFGGDHYMQYPDDERPVRFAMKGVCDMRKHTAYVFRLDEQPGGCFSSHAPPQAASIRVPAEGLGLVPGTGTK